MDCLDLWEGANAYVFLLQKIICGVVSGYDGGGASGTIITLISVKCKHVIILAILNYII